MPLAAAGPSATPETTAATVTMLTPHLACRGASAAIEFYKRAFGARALRVVRMPDGRVLHAALTVGDAMFFLCDECPEFGNKGPQSLGGTPVTLHLHSGDCDAVFDRAVSAGCTVRMPLQNMFWGERYGVLSDPYGHAWSVSTTVEQVATEEIQRRADAFAGGMNRESGQYHANEPHSQT